MVASDIRGQGVGRRLERAARERASLRGVRQLVAGIHVDNQAALEFYARCGYRDNATIRLADLDNVSASLANETAVMGVSRGAEA